jgi:hypothetical protein
MKELIPRLNDLERRWPSRSRRGSLDAERITTEYIGGFPRSGTTLMRKGVAGIAHFRGDAFETVFKL